MTPWGAIPWGAGTAADVTSVAGKAAGTGLSALTAISAASGGAATAGTGVVGSLLATAGISSTVPVAGWIAAGGMAAAAGTIATVKAIRAGKVRRAEAVAMAEKYGIDDAAEVPAFTARAIKLAAKNPTQLIRLGERLEKSLAKRSGDKGLLGKITSLGRNKSKLESKLRIVGAVLALQMAERRGREKPPRVARDVAQGIPWTSPQIAIPVLVFGVSLALLMVVRTKGGRRRSVGVVP